MKGRLMKYITHFWIVFASVFLETFRPIGCNFDLYTDAEEAELLYGLDSQEIFFIRNGVINQQAFRLLHEDIPPHVTRLVFRWHLSASDAGNTSYHLKILHSPGPIISTPRLNISSNGFIPSRDTAFYIELPCTGRVRDHVNVFIKMTFISKSLHGNDEPLDLKFQRRRFCEKMLSAYMEDGSNSPPNRDSSQTEDMVLPFPKLSPFASSAIAFGSASTSILLLLFLIGLIYATRKKRRPSTTPSSLVHLDYMPHHNLPSSSDEDKSFRSQEGLMKYCRVHPPGSVDSRERHQVSFLNSCSKSLSLHFRSTSEDQGRQLLQNYSSLSSASNQDPHSSIYKYLPSRDESSSLSNISPKGPRSLIIQDGILKLSSSATVSGGYPQPPPAPPPSVTNRIPHISSGSCSSYSSSSLSLNPPVPPLESSIPQSILSSSLTNSSNELFPNGETLGILTLPEGRVEQSPELIQEDDGGNIQYLPHLYPHLMPKNIKQATEPTKTLLA